MPKNQSSEADSKNVGPAAAMPEEQAIETPKQGTGRFHVVRGISYPIVRSYYDRNQDAVIDVVQVKKLIPRKNGTMRESTLHRHVYSKDEALQDKYCIKRAPKEAVNQSVIVDVE